MEHFSHKHPLILSKYYHSPPHALCSACGDPISSNTDFYHCIHESINIQDSACSRFLLHKACAHLPFIIQHPLHGEHMLTLNPFDGLIRCDPCNKSVRRWIYICRKGHLFQVCIKCTFLERELNHPSHSHTLTLMPQKATLQICTACGTQGSHDFSYFCKTCHFWMHKGCASAPPTLIREDHDKDHPLVLAYSLPKEYRDFGVSCYLCSEEIHMQFLYWVYYCAECRYFAHVHCALSAESRKDGIENGANLVHFPICDDKPYLYYRLIQQFAKKFSISTNEKSGKAYIISQCRSGHSLTLFENSNNKGVVQTNYTCDRRICDGCVQPLISSPPDPFYGCLDCNFFLHSLCAAELPREIQHASHTRNGLTRLTRCYETSNAFNFYLCGLCDRYCNGVVYYDESNKFWVDILCAALPSEIKHESHKHSLHLLSKIPDENKMCKGCSVDIYGHSFACKICDYYIHIKCALKRGTIKHRWDEHRLSLMYPPVKGHPHSFNCELCSEDINPNYWFYHCHKCDTSFNSLCIDQDMYSNIKYGGNVKADNLHQHPVELNISRKNFKCAECGKIRAGFKLWREDYEPWRYDRKPFIRCASCEFYVCMKCIIRHYGCPEREASRTRSVKDDYFQELFLL